MERYNWFNVQCYNFELALFLTNLHYVVLAEEL